MCLEDVSFADLQIDNLTHRWTEPIALLCFIALLTTKLLACAYTNTFAMGHCLYQLLCPPLYMKDIHVYISAAQASYLRWLNHTGVNAGQVPACDDCNSHEIHLPVNVPFGNHSHDSIYVSGRYVYIKWL